MTLGEFKKLTENIPNETQIIIRYYQAETTLEKSDISYLIFKGKLIIDI